MLNKDKNEDRILARSMAEELTAEEIEMVSGGCDLNTSGCTQSTCSSSDNNSCDLDTCGDTGDIEPDPPGAGQQF